MGGSGAAPLRVNPWRVPGNGGGEEEFLRVVIGIPESELAALCARVTPKAGDAARSCAGARAAERIPKPSRSPGRRIDAQTGGEPFGQIVPIARGDPNQLNGRPTLQRVCEGVTCDLDRRDQPDWPFEQPGDGGAERLRRELHLPELVDQHDAALRRRRQRGEGDPLEVGQVHAIPSDSRWAGKADVGKHAVRAGERLDCEADSAAAFADLLGDKARERNAGLAQDRPEPARDGRLADRRPALNEDEKRALRHSRAPYGA
jgi:hypothetical protein